MLPCLTDNLWRLVQVVRTSLWLIWACWNFITSFFSTCEDLQVVWTQNASWRKPLVSKLNYMAAYRMKSMLVWMKSFEVNLCWLLIKSSSWVYTSNFLLTSSHVCFWTKRLVNSIGLTLPELGAKNILVQVLLKWHYLVLN